MRRLPELPPLLNLEVPFARFGEGAFEVFSSRGRRGGEGEELGREREEVDAEGFKLRSEGEVEEVRVEFEAVEARGKGVRRSQRE